MPKKFIIIIIITLIIGLALLGWLYLNSQEPPSADAQTSLISSPFLKEYLAAGQYKVGVMPLYFHDPTRAFDSWNATHASDSYKALLKEINDAGENQIVSTLLWYPVDAQEQTSRQATFDDFSDSNSSVFNEAYQESTFFYFSNIVNEEIKAEIANNPGNRLEVLESALSNRRVLSSLLEQVKERVINSLYEAPIAPGSFPIIVAAHGLGGGADEWSLYAEYLASHGYVVIAPSFISDSSLPAVFNSPDSKYLAQKGARGLNRAYQIILSEDKVIPGFFKYFFGSEPPMAETFAELINPEGLQAIPGGGQRVGQMMGQFFTQRVDDVETIIDGLYSLNKPKDDCLSEYEQRGQATHGAQVCGLFSDTLDLNNVGIMGQSLGSMTAQFAVARSDRVVAAVGYNNASPRYWEPKGIFGNGVAADGQPAGNPKPVLQIHGSEDEFVQTIFRGLMWNTLLTAGGDPRDIWVLEKERVLPSNENPQPIARNAYTRATGDKMIISVKDVRHDDLVTDFVGVSSSLNPLMANGTAYWSELLPDPRKSVGEDVFNPEFQGELFNPLGWDKIEGDDVYLPVFVRNYYTKNWFDYYLKKDEAALVNFTSNNPVAAKGILDIKSSFASQ